jgi:hypothetical protein
MITSHFETGAAGVQDNIGSLLNQALSQSLTECNSVY